MSFLPRKSGVLLHISSLPGPFGIGDIGPSARNFSAFLARSGQKLWQVLPLQETSPALGNSPYSSPSAFAGNPLFLSPEDLAGRGLLRKEEITPPPFSPRQAEYGRAWKYKVELIKLAFTRFEPDEGYFHFLEEQKFWLNDYALFSALKEHFGGLPWNEWPGEIKFRREDALLKARSQLDEAVRFRLFQQYAFFLQMNDLKDACALSGVELMGDLPIYVNYDSADVWSHRKTFSLDGELRPREVAGVPPDYFSETGQLWGNPLYDWSALEEEGFSWWLKRLKHSLALFNLVRIDHFRGLLAYWAVPAEERTAERGVWREVPSEKFFAAMQNALPAEGFVAENLGIITPDVTGAMKRLNLPGMAVLLFAFGGSSGDNPHIPYNFQRELVAYTGTHDNNTALGWFRSDASEEERKALKDYLGRGVDEADLPDALIRLVLSSVADRAVIPLQDYLSLGEEARMNRPSTPRGNWEWRVSQEALTDGLAERMKRLAGIYGRD